MQGGINRKKDFLPKYKNNKNKKNKNYNSNNSQWLTTPMKKLLVYIFLLTLVYFLIKMGYSDMNKVPEFELGHEIVDDELPKQPVKQKIQQAREQLVQQIQVEDPVRVAQQQAQQQIQEQKINKEKAQLL